MLVELLIDFVTALLSDGLATPARSSRAAKRMLDESRKISCGIRAVEGRVKNIGTEWSWGTAELSIGHLRFIPRMGVVGNREIEVVDLRLAKRPEDAPPHLVSDSMLPVSAKALLVLSTLQGDLYWLVPTDLLEPAVRLLRPVDPFVS